MHYFFTYAIVFFEPYIFSNEYFKKIQDLKKKKIPRNECYERQAAIITEYIEKDKIYLDPNLNLEKLSYMTSLNRSLLSNIINQSFNKNFRQWINSYRFEEAKRLLQKKGDSRNILDIAFESGFNNEASFNASFKTYTNLTPKEYKNKSRK